MNARLPGCAEAACVDPTGRSGSLSARTLRMAAFRITLVAFGAGGVSYLVNHGMIEEAVRRQLVLSTEQTLQREALPFREIRELEQNFLQDFAAIYGDTQARRQLTRDFDLIFYRHADGSYTQRPGLFEGEALSDGRRFAGMSATYAPDIPPDEDIKARLTLSYVLSHKYGSAARGRLFNFYGVIPEKGFPIYQSADIAQVFTYDGPEALRLEDYEFYTRGFRSTEHATFFTRMYWDYSNNALMTTVATPAARDAAGRQRILACVDVLLDELSRRVAHPSIEGAHSTLFLADEEGTLIYHPGHMGAIRESEGKASLKSLGLKREYPLLILGHSLEPGQVALADTGDAIVAVGRLPETPGVLAIHYPKSLMRPAILQNLAIVVALGLLTLLVEIFIIRSVLQNQVAAPLARLTRATRRFGVSGIHLDAADLPTESRDEIGELARDFSHMAERVLGVQEQLEVTVQARTAELEEANRKLMAMSTTDGLTGICNRRSFDETLANEWQRAKRAGSHLALAMIDVDWFKSYNDHYGHPAGDECLRQVAAIIRGHARRASDFAARYGGEEFVLLTAPSGPEEAVRYAASLCAALRAREIAHDVSPYGSVTASIGVACVMPVDGTEAEDLIRQADDALYRAKQAGRNRVVCHGASMERAQEG